MNTDIIAEVLADLPDLVPQREYFRPGRPQPADVGVRLAAVLPKDVTEPVVGLRPRPC
jgi:hypothetical protein